MAGQFKEAGDDFYCWRFQVWYRTLDCAARTRFRTAPGCRDCAQGVQNLRLRFADVIRIKMRPDAIGFADFGGDDEPRPHSPARPGCSGADGPPAVTREGLRLVHAR